MSRGLRLVLKSRVYRVEIKKKEKVEIVITLSVLFLLCELHHTPHTLT